MFTERRSLERHVERNHTDNPAFNGDQCGRSYSRSGNLEMHKRTCTGPIVAPAPKRRRSASAVPEFTVRRKKRALGCTSEMYEVDMKESDNLTALQAVVTSFQPSMPTYRRDHSAYKFQKAVDVIFHKAVDPTVITQPAVTLTSEMVAVYGAPPLEDINRQHYSTIRNFSRLISGKLSNHGHAIYCCKKCLHAYSTIELLAVHAVDCCHVQRTKFPLDPRCHFTNIQKQLSAPFVVCADFESILKPVIEGVDVTQGVSTGTASSTTVYQEHVPCSFAYKVVSSVDPDFSRPLVMYRGEDAADKFVRDLQKEAKQCCDEYIAKPKTMIFSTEDSLSFTNATTCHICTKPVTDDDRVRDHCHITGIYRGADHSACNLNYRITPKSWKLPVVIHNLKGYDGHLIAKALKSEFRSVGVIPQNLERYLSLTVGQLKFLDSFQFTPKCLVVLSNTLEDDEFKYLVESCTTSHFDLVRRKGVYPYDYMDSVERFDETELPSQDAFFNKLSGSSCSDIDYAHASRVWDAFGCETIADYHGEYLQLDVLLLVDFFETFRRTCLDFYSLDPLYYYTTNDLALDAALRMSRVELELITDENIYNLIENSIH